MRDDPPPALLFEMMRSFVTLARTLNLSQAVRELGSTRQTLRRHIALLEEYKGGPLFSLHERQYHLSPLGRDSLSEAKRLLRRVDAWLHNETTEQGGLLHQQIQDGSASFLLQQHPLSEIWAQGAPLLQWGLQTWARAQGRLECAAFAPLRPYLQVFRPANNGWVCTDVGPKSCFATFFGWTWERSSIGRNLVDFPGGEGFAQLMAEPFADVSAHHGARFDHLFTRMVPEADAPAIAVSSQQLLLGCRFPDNSFALASLEHRTHDVSITGLPETMRMEMDDEWVMPRTLPAGAKLGPAQ